MIGEVAPPRQFSPWQKRPRGIAVAPDENATITVIGGGTDVSLDPWIIGLGVGRF